VWAVPAEHRAPAVGDAAGQRLDGGRVGQVAAGDLRPPAVIALELGGELTQRLHGHTINTVEGENPFGGMFGDPEDLQRRLAEFAEQMQGAQRVAWADNAIKLAVDMTVAAIHAIELSGTSDEQAAQVRDAIRLLFPEAVTLVREAREGLA
jgi:hypothetical protein